MFQTGNPLHSNYVELVCNIMPKHTAATFADYGFGLGCNTMEGREQKHQMIAKYQAHSTYHSRWAMTFRHEFIHLIYLRSHGFDKLRYKKKSMNYVPPITEHKCPRCYLLLSFVWKPDESLCPLCDHSSMEGAINPQPRK